jgi:tetratricopeptide (TPR) repeat protein
MFAPRVLALLLLAAAPVAWATDAEWAAEGRALLEQTTEGLFGETIPPATVHVMLDRCRASFERIGDACDRTYWAARVEVILGFAERSEGRVREAEARFARAQEMAKEAVACRETSDGYRVLADTYAQLITFRGFLYALAHGRKLLQYCEKAIALDPDNLDARLTLAIAHFYTPGIAGGGVDRSLSELRALEARPNITRLRSFTVGIWIALALDKKGRHDEARARLDQATSLYPMNTWARGLLDDPQLK